jgi:hypothetical protein
MALTASASADPSVGSHPKGFRLRSVASHHAAKNAGGSEGKTRAAGAFAFSLEARYNFFNCSDFLNLV